MKTYIREQVCDIVKSLESDPKLKDFKVNYGLLVTVKDTVLHFCAYESIPTDADITHVRNEMFLRDDNGFSYLDDYILNYSKFQILDLKNFKTRSSDGGNTGGP